jgi:hypothetical protein
MTTTLISSPASVCAHSVSASVSMSAASMMSALNADAPVAAAVPAWAPATAITTDVTTYVTNQWLGGTKGFGTKHATVFATKRFIPGRLEGMT